MIKDAADRAHKVATKSNDPAYSDTGFAAFKGKVRGAQVVQSDPLPRLCDRSASMRYVTAPGLVLAVAYSLPALCLAVFFLTCHPFTNGLFIVNLQPFASTD